MYIRIVGEETNVLFECDRVIENEVGLFFYKGDEVFIELLCSDEEKLQVYCMNDSGKTIDSWSIFPEG